MQYYARAIEKALGSDDVDAFRRDAEAYLAGDEPAPGYDDWDSLARIARRFHARRDGMQQAFLQTRRFMLGQRCPLDVPEGLTGFLDSVEGVAFRLALSNSPASSVDPLLKKLGLLAYLDRTEASAHKPAGLVPRVERVLAETSLAGVPVLSIGDHLKNDIEPAREAGWDTAYIQARPDFPVGVATFRASALEALLPDLRTWVLEKSRSVS